jgi:hypothetical protein
MYFVLSAVHCDIVEQSMGRRALLRSYGTSSFRRELNGYISSMSHSLSIDEQVAETLC